MRRDKIKISLRVTRIESDNGIIGIDLSKCTLKIAMKFTVEVVGKVVQIANKHMEHCNLLLQIFLILDACAKTKQMFNRISLHTSYRL